MDPLWRRPLDSTYSSVSTFGAPASCPGRPREKVRNAGKPPKPQDHRPNVGARWPFGANRSNIVFQILGGSGGPPYRIFPQLFRFDPSPEINHPWGCKANSNQFLGENPQKPSVGGSSAPLIRDFHEKGFGPGNESSSFHASVN